MSVSASRRIEVHTMKGCDPCDKAVYDLISFAEEKQIPLHIIPVTDKDTDTVTVPKVCVIEEKDEIATRKCIEGYDKDLVKDVEDMFEEIGNRKKP